MTEEPVRLDRWLWAARFYKTRGAATDAVLGGRVHVNDERVKPARGIHVGDRVEVSIADVRRTVVVLDVAGISPVCDYFVLATGTSSRQLRSVGEELVELARARDFAPMNRSSASSDAWILVDCFDVVIHLFSEDARHYYDLDNLWGDAKKVAWEKKSDK